MTYDFDDQHDEELNNEVLQKFSNKLESAINEVMDENTEPDSRLELLVTLLSFAAQISQDLGIDETKFTEISGEFYQQTEDLLAEEHLMTVARKKAVVLN